MGFRTKLLGRADVPFTVTVFMIGMSMALSIFHSWQVLGDYRFDAGEGLRIQNKIIGKEADYTTDYTMDTSGEKIAVRAFIKAIQKRFNWVFQNTPKI